ncbi:CATRA conflict system CASPASE/TPR repeat-associated protein [Streptomyces sp. NPDC054863]
MASAADDTRGERRFGVVGCARGEAALSDWAWLGPGHVLPPFAKYLLHAAKLRHQLRVWDGGRGMQELRQEADSALPSLLETVLPGPGTRDPHHEELAGHRAQPLDPPSSAPRARAPRARAPRARAPSGVAEPAQKSRGLCRSGLPGALPQLFLTPTVATSIAYLLPRSTLPASQISLISP